MVEALQAFSFRLEQFIERERTFTRDAGHELRTPIAVLKGSLDILETNKQRSDTDLQALQRMRRVLSDMETLLETLLMLAREEDVFADDIPTSVNQVIAELERWACSRQGSCEVKASNRSRKKPGCPLPPWDPIFPGAFFCAVPSASSWTES